MRALGAGHHVVEGRGAPARTLARALALLVALVSREEEEGVALLSSRVVGAGRLAEPGADVLLDAGRLRAEPLDPGRPLVLGEGSVEEAADLERGERLEEVEGHRVAGPELARQGLGAAAHRGADLVDVEGGTRDHDREPDPVLAATARPPGHLLELPGQERPLLPAVPDQRTGEAHAAGREVDAGRHRRGAEDGVEEALVHQRLETELPARVVTGVVGRHPGPGDHVEVAVPGEGGDVPHQLVEDLSDPGPALGCEAGLLGLEEEVGRLVALRSRAHEHEGREEIVPAQDLDQVEGAGALPGPGPAVAPPGSLAPPLGDLVHGPVELLPVGAPEGAELQGALVDEGGPQGHRTDVGVDDHHVGATDLAHPGGEVLGVLDGGREEEAADRGRGEDDRLLPGHPAVGVAEVVGLVEDREPEVDPALATEVVVQAVAVDLGGGDEHRCGEVLLAVAGRDPHHLRSQLVAELEELGVGEGLERRGVPGAAPRLELGPDGLDRDPRLPGPGGGSDDHVSLPGAIEGLELERVGLEGPGLGDPHPLEEGLQLALGDDAARR